MDFGRAGLWSHRGICNLAYRIGFGVVVAFHMEKEGRVYSKEELHEMKVKFWLHVWDTAIREFWLFWLTLAGAAIFGIAYLEHLKSLR